MCEPFIVPRLIREVLYAPTIAPPQTAHLFEVALSHHNTHNFVDAVNLYMEALESWEMHRVREEMEAQNIVPIPKKKSTLEEDLPEGEARPVDPEEEHKQEARNQLLYTKAEMVPVEGRIFIRLAVGEVFESAGNDQQALSEYHAALMLVQTIPIFQTNLITATVYACLGSVYHHLAQYDFAADYFFRALEIREQQLTDKHVDVASMLNNIGATLYQLGRNSDALIMFTKAHQIMEPQLGKAHPRMDTVQSNLRVGKLHLLKDAHFPTVPFTPYTPPMCPGAKAAQAFFLPKAKKPKGKDDKKKK